MNASTLAPPLGPKARTLPSQAKREKPSAEKHVPKKEIHEPIQEELKTLHDPIEDIKLENKRLENQEHWFADHSVMKFIADQIIEITTKVSATLNFISAPARFLSDENFFKKLLNNFSMFSTQGHALVYSLAGLGTAIKQKNPYLIFSFLTEGLAAFMPLRKFYLFRGVATGVDGAVAGINDKHVKKYFPSYGEAAKYYWSKTKDILSEIWHNPRLAFNFKDIHGCLASSFCMVFGAFWGLGVEEKSGAALRDGAGGVNDYSLCRLSNPVAQKSGKNYLIGSAVDISARLFTENVAKKLGINNTKLFSRCKDFLHEIAIAFDRLGQFHFLRFNQNSASVASLVA